MPDEPIPIPVPQPEGHETDNEERKETLHDLGQKMRWVFLTGGDKPGTWDEIAQLAVAWAPQVLP